MGKLLFKKALVNILYLLPVKIKMLCNLFNSHISAKSRNMGSKPACNPLIGIHKGKLFYQGTAVGTPQLRGRKAG
jgi:hypothetical protein